MNFIKLHKKYLSIKNPYLTVKYDIESNKDLIRFNGYFSFMKKYSITCSFKNVKLSREGGTDITHYNQSIKFNNDLCVILTKENYSFLKGTCIKYKLLRFKDLKEIITLDIFCDPFKLHLIIKKVYKSYIYKNLELTFKIDSKSINN